MPLFARSTAPKSASTCIFDGLVVMISACQDLSNKRGRPGFDSPSESHMLQASFFWCLFRRGQDPFFFFFFWGGGGGGGGGGGTGRRGWDVFG
ncbi:hypothetical protein HBH48_161970 [Parastagonospora nodorum]|nr:hypothetical protein HBH48_161970 [Parastagonospora nodorum]